MVPRQASTSTSTPSYGSHNVSAQKAWLRNIHAFSPCSAIGRPIYAGHHLRSSTLSSPSAVTAPYFTHHGSSNESSLPSYPSPSAASASSQTSNTPRIKHHSTRSWAKPGCASTSACASPAPFTAPRTPTAPPQRKTSNTSKPSNSKC